MPQNRFWPIKKGAGVVRECLTVELLPEFVEPFRIEPQAHLGACKASADLILVVKVFGGSRPVGDALAQGIQKLAHPLLD